MGAASLAQVHKAVLKNGQEVAVKVQHHYVRGNCAVDLLTMEYAVRAMGIIFPEFKLQWLVDESKKNIPIELNFLTEGRNTEKVSHDLHELILRYFNLFSLFFQGPITFQGR